MSAALAAMTPGQLVALARSLGVQIPRRPITNHELRALLRAAMPQDCADAVLVCKDQNQPAPQPAPDTPLEAMTRPQLLDLAHKRGVQLPKCYLTKDEIVDLLQGKRPRAAGP